MNADGSGQTALTDSQNGAFGKSWTAGGTAVPASATITTTGRIAYGSRTGGNADSFSEIWVMNADGSSHTRLTNNNYYEDEPAWSPDGTKLAYASAADGNT